jgi:O-antigen ligase
MSREVPPPAAPVPAGAGAGAEAGGGAETRGADGAGWTLLLLLVGSAACALPELFDMDAFKTACVSLLAAAVLLPWVALKARTEVRAWLSCAGGRLSLLAALLAVPAALSAPWSAAATDRVLLVLLTTLAAVLGMRAARAGAGRYPLATAVQLAALVTAVVVLLQAVGIEQRFSPPEDDVLLKELVGLMGNSTRSGALLALGVVAALATVAQGALAERDARMRFALGTLLLGTAALVLTRARGGWLGAAAGLAAVAATDLPAARASMRLWLSRLLLGAVLAAVLAGGTQIFTAGKLPGSGTVLSGADLTTNVRLSVWRGTAAMIAQRPLLGHGLGGYRAGFPPFRDPVEAAMPGLAGAATEVDHPHDEFLLAAAEGGLAAGLALLAFALLTLRHGWRLARAPDSPPLAHLAFGVFAAGVVVACVQNAWTTPGTALPAFAAAGAVWGLRAARSAPGAEPGTGAEPAPGEERGALRLATIGGVLAALAALAALAVPRLEAQLRLRSFYRSADDVGINADNLRLLVDAAEADPGDVNVQRLLVVYGGELLAALPAAAPRYAAPVAAARERLARLAPHLPPIPAPR